MRRKLVSPTSFAVSLVLGLAGGTACAFDFDNENIACVVKGIYSVDPEGRIAVVDDKRPSTLLEKSRAALGIGSAQSITAGALNSFFTVNRRTGAFTGRILRNDGQLVTVLDRGSSEQSVKILSTSRGGYLHAQYLQVDLFTKEDRKPMRLIDGGTIYTGYCE